MKNFKLNTLIFLFTAFLLSGCLSSYVSVDLVKKFSSKTLLSLFVSDVTTDKKFGKSGELNLNSDIGKFLLKDELNIRGFSSDNQNGFYVELGELGATDRIIRLNNEGNYDASFGTIYHNEGVKVAGEFFKIYHVYSDGSFLVGGPAIANSCPNVFSLSYSYPCLVLKKYLPTGKLDTSFSNDGVLDLPVSLETNNYGMYVKVLSNSQIFVASQFTDPNSVTGIVPFYNLLSEEGAILIANRIPDVQNFTPFEQIVDIKEIAGAKLQVTSRYQGSVYKRILNADLTADNTYNSNLGYSVVNMQESYMVQSFVKGDDIIFLQNTIQMDAGVNLLNSNYYSSIAIYNRTTEAFIEQRIHNPIIAGTGRTFIRGGIFNSQDDEMYLFTLIGNGSGVKSKMITRYKTDVLGLDISYQSSGFLTFPGTVAGIYLPYEHFFAANDQRFFEVSNGETLCDAENLCRKSYFETVYDTEGAPSTTTDIPINGKIADFKILRQLKSSGDIEAYRIFSNGDMLILYSDAKSTPFTNENFMVKLSSAGKLENSFGVNGLVEFGKGIVKNISKYNDYYYIFYYEPQVDTTLTFYVKKLKSNGALDTSFGVGGRLLIESGLAISTAYTAINGGAYKHDMLGKKVVVNFHEESIEIDDRFVTNFVHYKINTNTQAVQKTIVPFTNVQNYITANYMAYTLMDARTTSTKTMFLIKGTKNAFGDIEIILVSVDASGNYINEFGQNGILKLKEAIQSSNNYQNIGMSFDLVDNKIQMIFSRIELFIAEQRLYGDSSFMIIDNATGVIDSQISMNNGAGYDVYMASEVKTLSTNSTIFSGLKAKEYSLSDPPEYEGTLSYLSVNQGVATHKEINFDQSDILKNSIIMTMQPVGENLYVVVNQNLSGKYVYRYLKLSPR